MPHLRRSFTALIVALAAGCAMDVEGELPDVEVTNHEIQVPAAPASPDGLEPRVGVQFSQRPPRLQLPKELISEVRVLSIVVTARAGVSDMSFVRNARLLASAPEAATVELGTYDRARDATETPGASLILLPEVPVDVTELWRASKLTYQVEVQGALPNSPWAADLAIRLAVKVKY